MIRMVMSNRKTSGPPPKRAKKGSAEEPQIFRADTNYFSLPDSSDSEGEDATVTVTKAADNYSTDKRAQKTIGTTVPNEHEAEPTRATTGKAGDAARPALASHARKRAALSDVTAAADPSGTTGCTVGAAELEQRAARPAPASHAQERAALSDVTTAADPGETAGRTVGAAEREQRADRPAPASHAHERASLSDVTTDRTEDQRAARRKTRKATAELERRHRAELLRSNRHKAEAGRLRETARVAGVAQAAHATVVGLLADFTVELASMRKESTVELATVRKELEAVRAEARAAEASHVEERKEMRDAARKAEASHVEERREMRHAVREAEDLRKELDAVQAEARKVQASRVEERREMQIETGEMRERAEAAETKANKVADIAAQLKARSFFSFYFVF
eukprot:CAMPEP_0194330778 /NCGR_PEP_ID=MMETSP0171-20130528/53242_1 /TAXON_ID=218684 /ORGANISM="Corethron pennatum, Strain L29A3" /LENGTH=397 /DNA_ID=CAMNT_0039091969 /DNA_START=131 /DNA_END=1324 /DNA_ORIENTATION=+